MTNMSSQPLWLTQPICQVNHYFLKFYREECMGAIIHKTCKEFEWDN